MKELNNQYFIDQISQLDPSELEPLYWKMEDALWEGKKELAKNIHHFFSIYCYLS